MHRCWAHVSVGRRLRRGCERRLVLWCGGGSGRSVWSAVSRCDADGRIEGGDGGRCGRGRNLAAVAGELEVARGSNAADGALALLDVALRLIVHIEPAESERDAEALEGVHGLREPDDRDADDGDALDERRDAIGDGRCLREEDERDDVLREVHGAVREEGPDDGVMPMPVRWVRYMRRVVDEGEQGREVVVYPDGDHQHEGHT